MGLQPLTSSVCPVTLDDAKDHLRIDGTQDDDTLTANLSAACDYIERETRQQLVARDFLMVLDSFPAERFTKLPKPPLLSVASVKYTDATGTEQTIDPAAYTVDAVTIPGRIVLAPGQSWPGTNGSANCVRIRFTAGYANAAAVPPLLVQGIKLLVGHYFENREAATDRRIDTVPLAVESIVNMFAFPEAVG